MSCSQCNRPCIRVGGKCIIAELRNEFNLTFKEAWEAVTKIELNDKCVQAYVRKHTETYKFLNEKFKLIKVNRYNIKKKTNERQSKETTR